jgi:hypothetical protein
VIERAIANFKTWRCMHTDYRRPKRTYVAAFNAIRRLIHKPPEKSGRVSLRVRWSEASSQLLHNL